MKVEKIAEELNASSWRSPIGWLRVVAGREGILEVLCHPESDPPLNHPGPGVQSGEGTESDEAIVQLQEYFAGKRRSFSLRLNFDRLSPFVCAILKNLSAIPFGQTVTYGELAALAGRPGAARAVGRAMALNPFLIIVPCHRVLGAGDKMTGYSGGAGIATKECLLAFERVGFGGLRGPSANDLRKIQQCLKSA